MDVNQIVADSTCVSQSIPAGLLPGVKTYLLCQLSNTGEIVPPEPVECDADAQNFFLATGLSDLTIRGAICQLVSDLKNTVPATTPAKTFWSREKIIYPLVGDGATTFAQQRVNLKTPGTFDFTQTVGATPIYSALGIQGVIATFGRVNTGFTPSIHLVGLLSISNYRVMWYVDLNPTNDFGAYFGCQTNTGTGMIRAIGSDLPSTINFLYDASSNNTNTQAGPVAGQTLGIKFIQRNNDAANMQSAYGATSFVSSARVATGPCNQPMHILAGYNGGPVLPGNARISGFSLGEPLSDAERAQYKTIWDRFETAIGRGHP